MQSVAISKPLNPKSLNSLMIRFTSPALNTTFKTERRLSVTLKAAHLICIYQLMDSFDKRPRHHYWSCNCTYYLQQNDFLITSGNALVNTKP